MLLPPSCSVVSDFVTPWTTARQAPLSMGILQARILEWVAIHSSRGSSNPGIKPRSPVLQADSLPSEPLGKPKNMGVGSLSLLQGYKGIHYPKFTANPKASSTSY